MLSRENQVQTILLQSEAIEIKSDDSYFTWTSGIKSPIYCDNRLLLSNVKGREEVVDFFIELIKDQKIKVDVLAGVATAGIPWASLIAQKMNLPMIFVRQKAKDHGQNKQIEGRVDKNQDVLVIEDLVSTGKSSAAVIRTLKEEKLKVSAMLSIFSYGLDISKKVFSDLETPLYSLVDLPFLMKSSHFTSLQQDRLKHFWNELNQ